MSYETKTFRLVPDRWIKLSVDNTDDFDAQARSELPFMVSVGSTEPAAGDRSDLARTRFTFNGLDDAAVWGKAIWQDTIVTVMRRVAAGNVQPVELQPLQLSATTFRINAAAGVDIGTFATRSDGSSIALKRASGAASVSPDSTKLVVGSGSLDTGKMKLIFIETHPLAINSGLETTIELEILPAVALALALKNAAPASIYAKVGQEFRFSPTPLNIVGASSASRVGAALPADATFDAVTGEIVVPASALNKPMVFETGEISITDARGTVVKAINRAILVSDIDFTPIYPNNTWGYGLDPFDNSVPTWGNHSAFSPYSMSSSPEGRVRRYAITRAGERWKPNASGVEANQRSEAKGNMVFPFGSLISLAWGARDYGLVGAIRTDPGDWHIMRQIHAVTQSGDGGTSPPISITRVDENTIALYTLFTDTLPLQNGSAGKTQKIYGPFACSQGSRHTFVLEARMGNGDGTLMFSIDGVRVIDETGLQLGFVGRDNYDKEGIYHGFGDVLFPGYAIEIDNLRKSNRVSLSDYVSNPLRLDGTRLKPIASQPAVITGSKEVGQSISIAFPTVQNADKLAYSIRSASDASSAGSAISGATGLVDNAATVNFQIPAGIAGRYLNVAFFPIRDYGKPEEQRGGVIQTTGYGPVADAAAITPLTLGRIEHPTADGSVGQTYTYTPATWPAGTSPRTYQWSRITADANLAETMISGATNLTYQATDADIGCYLRCSEKPNANSVTRARSSTVVLAPPILLMPMDDATGIYVSVGNGRNTLSYDTTDKVQGAASLHVEQVKFQYGEERIHREVANLDPSTFENIAFAVKCDPHSTNYVQPTIGRGGTYCNIAAANANKVEPTSFVATSDDQQRGWRWWSTPMSAFLSAPTGVGTVQTRLTVGHRSPWDQDLKVDAVCARARGRPTLCLTFDDNHSGLFYRGKPIFDQYGIKVTGYLVPDTMGGGGRMTWPLWRQLDAEGHDVACDSWSDGPFTNNTDAAAAVAEWQRVKQAILSNGISDRAVDHLCYPNGTFMIDSPKQRIAATGYGTDQILLQADPTIALKVGMTVRGFGVPRGTTIKSIEGTRNLTLSAVTAGAAGGSNIDALLFVDESSPFYGRKLQDAFAAAGLKTGRLTQGGSNLTRFGFADQAQQLIGQGFTGGGFSIMKAWVDAIIARGTTGIPYFHNIIPTTEGQSIHVYDTDLAQLCAYAAQKRDEGILDIMTVSQMWQRDFASSFPVAA